MRMIISVKLPAETELTPEPRKNGRTQRKEVGQNGVETAELLRNQRRVVCVKNPA